MLPYRFYLLPLKDMYAAKMQLKLMDESLEQFSGSLLLIKYAYLNETTFTP